jgi:PAS domain S-box-containing protein
MMAVGTRVLLVDDEDVLLKLGKQYLEQGGDFSVDTIQSAREALEILKKTHYDAIVSDYQMLGMDGIAFLKQVRTTDKTTPFILFTGRGREEIVIDALNNEADFYLEKAGEPKAFFAELLHVIKRTVQMRRTELTLADQEQRYHDLQNANDLIQSIAPDGHFLFVNKKWLDTLGYQEHELENLTIFDIIHKDSLKHCMDIFPRVIAGENVGIIDAIFKTHDGGRVYVEGMATCKLVDGVCKYTRGIFKDVTQKKEIEQGLYESETKFATVFKSNPVALTLVAATDGVFVDVNDVFLRNTGYNRSEVIGRTSDEIGIFADKNESIRLTGEIREKHFVRGMEIHCRIKSGEIRICRFSSNIIITGNEPHILSTVEDITEQKASEAALHALVTGMVGTTGRESLERITESISAWLGADCIMIGEIMPNREQVQVLSMLLDGRQVQDYSYTLKGTPCEDTAKKGFCLYPDNAASLFPDSKDIRELMIRGYAGTSLRNPEGEVVGILCILSRTPLLLPPNAREIIDIIAAKAAAEIGRMNALVALRKSEERFRQIAESSGEWIWEVDSEGLYTYSSGSVEKILGYTPEELVGRMHFYDLFPPGVREELKTASLSAFDKREPMRNFINPVLDKSGGRVILETSGVPAFDEKNRFIGYIGADLDITNRKRMEEALHENEKKFRTIFENSPYPIAINSLPDNKFIEVNPAFINTSGYAREEIMGKNPIEIGLVSLLDATRLIARRILDGKIENVPLALSVKDGKRVHVLFSTIPITINDKPAIMTTAAETTTLKRVEEELIRKNEELMAIEEELRANNEELRRNQLELGASEKRYRTLFENMLDGFAYCTMLYDKSGRPEDFIFLQTNLAFLQMMGQNRLIGQRATEAIPGIRELHPELFEVFGRVSRTGKPEIVEFWFKPVGKWVEVSIFSAEKECFVAVFEDFTERRNAQEALRQVNKKLNLLSSITRHDINNQLLTLNGFIALLKKKNSDPSLQDYISRMSNATSLISSMIRFTKEYEQVGVNAPAWQDLRTLVNNAENLSTLGWVTLSNDIPAGSEVFADPLIAKVFFNLIDNALRHGGKIRSIRFALEPRGESSILICEDDGDGIPPELKERIFERGFGRNTGFGLSISRNILDITGIVIKETGVVGTGARFEITIPHGQFRSVGE